MAVYLSATIRLQGMVVSTQTCGHGFSSRQWGREHCWAETRTGVRRVLSMLCRQYINTQKPEERVNNI
jgi:hypothetical protein